jgi:hypothetical protein
VTSADGAFDDAKRLSELANANANENTIAFAFAFAPLRHSLSFSSS